MSMPSPARTFSPRRSFRATRRGQTLVEYALILAFIAVVAIGVLMALGGSVKTSFASTNVQLTNAQAGGGSIGRGG